MKLEHLRKIGAEGPTHVYQKSVLLMLALFTNDDNVVVMEDKKLFKVLDVSTKHLERTLNELIKKGWVDRSAADTYRVDPFAADHAHLSLYDNEE